MKTELSIAILCIFACLVIAGCGDDDNSDTDDGGAGDSDSDGDTDTDTDGDSDSDGDVLPECAALVDGMNTGFPVGDETYDLILHIPDGAADDGSGDWAVVFNWHSLGTNAEAFDDMISGNYNNSEMPFIGVTPDSNGHVIMTMPVTTSPRPSRVTAPCRVKGAITTSPRSFWIRASSTRQGSRSEVAH